MNTEQSVAHLAPLLNRVSLVFQIVSDLSHLDISPPGPHFSAEVTGTIRFERGENYTFLCSFSGYSYAWLHVGDHMVCQACSEKSCFFFVRSRLLLKVHGLSAL